MDDFLAEIRNIEQKWQKAWQDSGIFVGKRDETKPKFFMTVPYPYASGPLHIGHCRTYNMGDIITRYKRHQGFNAMWPMGFHITGTPVLSISSRIHQKDSKIWDQYRKYVGIYESDPSKIDQIVSTFVSPQNLAQYFASKLMGDFQRMGFSIDPTRQFTTGDKEYNKFIEWQYKILIDKGYITQGDYPILWCSNDNNAVGEDDIIGGDEEKITVNEYYGVKFKMENGSSLIAATLRPETIHGATNIWINPSALYSEVELDGERVILSKSVLPVIRMQNHSVKIIKSIMGSTLIGKNVKIPLNERKIPIFPAEFVDENDASGIVYSVPAHAPYDYIALRDIQSNIDNSNEHHLNINLVKSIQPISLVEVSDYGEFPAIEICKRMKIVDQTDTDKLELATQEIYKAEFYSGHIKSAIPDIGGLSVEAAKQNISSILDKGGLITKIYQPSSKATCRCGAEITAAIVLDQYFLNYGNPQWKEKAFQALEQMEISPKKYRRSFVRNFDWLDKRPCVRQRGLGTEFPLSKGKGWIIESLSDSVIYMAFYTIIKQIREQSIEPDQLIPEVWSYIFLKKGNRKKISTRTNIPENTLAHLRSEFEYWYPNDLRHTAINHISNHLSFAIFHHAAIFSKKYWPRTFTLNDMLIREGQKMGKSKGNIIPMAEIPRIYSVDLSRLHLASVATADSVVDWRDKEVAYSMKKLKKFWNLAKEVSAFDRFPGAQLTFQSRLLRAQILRNRIRCQKLMETYSIREYIQTIFFDSLQCFDRYLKTERSSTQEEWKYVIKACIESILMFLAPVIPHIAEELHEKFGLKINSEDFISIHHFPDLSMKASDELIIQQGEFLSDFTADIEQIIRISGISPKKIHCYVCPEWKQRLFELLLSDFSSSQFEFPLVMNAVKKDSLLSPKIREIARELKAIQKTPKIVHQDLLSLDDQISCLRENLSYLRRYFNGAEIKLITEPEESGAFKESHFKKIRFARPMKPAIVIE